MPCIWMFLISLGNIIVSNTCEQVFAGAKKTVDRKLGFMIETRIHFREDEEEAQGMVKIDVDKCVGCGGCIDLCPATAITLVDDRSHVNIDLCLECFTCVKVCPVKAPQQV